MTRQILALVLVGSGLVGVVGLAFVEVGLSEDPERRAGRAGRHARRPAARFRPRRPQ